MPAWCSSAGMLPDRSPSTIPLTKRLRALFFCGRNSAWAAIKMRSLMQRRRGASPRQRGQPAAPGGAGPWCARLSPPRARLKALKSNVFDRFAGADRQQGMHAVRSCRCAPTSRAASSRLRPPLRPRFLLQLSLPTEPGLPGTTTLSLWLPWPRLLHLPWQLCPRKSKLCIGSRRPQTRP